MLEALLQLDSDLFLRLNSLHTTWWDTAMLFITRKETWIPFYIILMVIIFRNYGKKGWIVIVFLLLGILACDQLSTWIKEVTHRLRPGYDPAIQNLTHIVLKKGGLYSFVSSHASNTFFVLTLTGLIFRNYISFWPVFFWALLVSWSRIYTGAHFPLDVAGGWIIGILSGIIFYKLTMTLETSLFYRGYPRIEKNRLSTQNSVLLLLTLATIFATLFLLTYILHKYNLLVKI
jgi:undecaprenyl-diphosphatase